MKKPVIAIDIDDVLAANVPAFLAFSNKKWGTHLTIEDFHEDWATMWGVDHSVVEERSMEMDKAGVFRNHPHFDEALPVLKKLSKSYTLVIATSRRKNLNKDTMEWIEQYFPNIFKEVHYAGIWDDFSKYKDAHLQTKGELVRQIGADYFIDDQPKHCFAAAEAGIQTLLFGDYPWNRDVQSSQRIARVHNWQEVEAYFDGR